MEFILLIVIITSIITNLITINTVKKFQWAPIETELFPILDSTGCNCGEVLSEEFKEILAPLLEEEPVKVPQLQDESHKAWRNQKEEPIVAPASPHGPPPKLEPLARPYGFSR